MHARGTAPSKAAWEFSDGARPLQYRLSTPRHLAGMIQPTLRRTAAEELPARVSASVATVISMVLCRLGFGRPSSGLRVLPNTNLRVPRSTCVSSRLGRLEEKER